jgi:ABC-type phosphate/phosphonate transport system substrate-binding protein
VSALVLRSLQTAAVALTALLPQPARGAETSQAPEPIAFKVGMSSACFRNVNRNDAVAAYRVFLEATGRRYGNVFKADTEIFDDAPTFEAALRREPKHLAVIEVWQYLSMDLTRCYRPFFAVSEHGKVGRKYLILTRRNSGFQTLADLRGQKILELRHSSASVGRAWLNTLLLAGHLGTQETFFGGVETVEKPTAAVLPVFFGKQAACLVDEPAFEVMVELNPQVGQTLQAVTASEAFADVVLCLSETGWRTEKDKTDTIKSLEELHAQPAGQQILTLFQIDRMVPFQEAQLDTVRKLRATYESLRKAAQP